MRYFLLFLTFLLSFLFLFISHKLSAYKALPRLIPKAEIIRAMRYHGTLIAYRCSLPTRDGNLKSTWCFRRNGMEVELWLPK